MNQASVRQLALHCGLSDGSMSRHCNAEEVPTEVLAAMRTFVTPTGKHIPSQYLPLGRDKKPGPEKGWLEKKLAEASAQDAA
jgi:hypothetical protein